MCYVNEIVIVANMGEYDVDLANGDLYSPQQKTYAQKTRTGNRSQTAITREKDEQFRKKTLAYGVDRKKRNPVTEAERITVAKLSGEGMSAAEIAVKVSRSMTTVTKILQTSEIAAKEIGLDWKQIQKEKAVLAVNDALDHKVDLYKRGTIGIAALKGLGEYEKDTGSIQAFIASIPPDMKSRYLDSDEVIAEARQVKEIPDAISTEKR